MSVTVIQNEVLDYLGDTLLPKIDGTGDYNTDLETISKDRVTPSVLSSTDYPAVCITDTSDTRINIIDSNNNLTLGDPNNFEDGWIPALIGFVRVKQDSTSMKEGKLKKEMTRLRADMEMAIWRDKTLGGLVDICQPVSQHYRPPAAGSNIGQVGLGIVIKYDYNPAEGVV